MTGGRSLFGPAFVYTLTNALAAGIPFLLLPVLTRALTPEQYGQVAMFGVVVTALGALTGLNVHGSVGVRYFDRESLDYPRYVGACVLILACSTAVVALLAWSASSWLQELTKLPTPWLLAAVLVSGAQILVQTQLSIWQAVGQPWRYGAVRVAQSATDAALSLVLVLMFAFGWQGRVSGMAVAIGFAAVVALVLMRRGGWMRFPVRREDVVSALHFGVPLIPHVIGGMLIAMIDRVMISNVLDVASTGIYMVALQIGMVLGLAADSFNRAYAPWLFETLTQRDARKEASIVRFTYGYFVVVIAIAVLLGVTAPVVLGFLVGEQFRSAAPIVIYITLGYAFSGMYYMVTNYVFLARHTARLALVTITCGSLNVGLSYYLLNRNGVIGAAQAFMTAQFLLFAATWWLASRSRPMPWRAALFALRQA